MQKSTTDCIVGEVMAREEFRMYRERERERRGEFALYVFKDYRLVVFYHLLLTWYTSLLPSSLQSLLFGYATSVPKSITLPIDCISRRHPNTQHHSTLISLELRFDLYLPVPKPHQTHRWSLTSSFHALAILSPYCQCFIIRLKEYKNVNKNTANSVVALSLRLLPLLFLKSSKAVPNRFHCHMFSLEDLNIDHYYSEYVAIILYRYRLPQ
jgi:hypothetical protein